MATREGGRRRSRPGNCAQYKGARAWHRREWHLVTGGLARRGKGVGEFGDVALDMAEHPDVRAADGVARGKAGDVPEQRIQHGAQNRTDRLRDGGRDVLGWGGWR